MLDRSGWKGHRELRDLPGKRGTKEALGTTAIQELMVLKVLGEIKGPRGSMEMTGVPDPRDPREFRARVALETSAGAR